MDDYVKLALVFNPLKEPVMRSAIGALRLPSGSQGLDAGCGIGLQALLLADAVGPAGHITGLDLSPAFLARAEEVVERAGQSDTISFRQGDVNSLPFDDDTFDWAWSVDCVGYAPMDPLPPVKELLRVVKPGGSLAILAWSSEMLLPGYPVLEARLRATRSGIAPFVCGKRPDLHFLRALGWLRGAGLQATSASAFAGSAHAPLREEIREALVALFRMRWPRVEAELNDADRTEFRRLCLPGSPDFIVDHPDYYAFFTYSMVRGSVFAPD
jgi:demethylmenaquinone methyltransferase/2-methoxy-6-polyprenyl-1,4-benzoquinol methylase